MPAYRFEVGEAAVPTIEANVLGAEPALFGRLQHRKEVIILSHLRLAFCRRLVQAAIAGQTAQAVGPQERGEADAFHDCMMLAAPMAADQAHLLGIRPV